MYNVLKWQERYHWKTRNLLKTSLARRTMVTDGCFRSSSSQRTSAVSVKTFQTQCEWMKREEVPLQYTFYFVQSMYKQLVDVDVFKFKNHECSATHEICQKFYMTGFLGQKFYRLKVRQFWLFSLRIKQCECINISKSSHFLFKFQQISKVSTVSV